MPSVNDGGKNQGAHETTNFARSHSPLPPAPGCQHLCDVRRLSDKPPQFPNEPGLDNIFSPIGSHHTGNLTKKPRLGKQN